MSSRYFGNIAESYLNDLTGVTPTKLQIWCGEAPRTVYRSGSPAKSLNLNPESRIPNPEADPGAAATLITALETLWVRPNLARGVLGFLAATQASEINPDNEAEPGKVIREMREGEMAALAEIPFRKYYGTVNATLSFVILAGQYYRRTGDRHFIEFIWSNIKRAVRWIDDFGVVDGDGFVEYESRNARGLTHQCWKASNDSIFDADGRSATGAIAVSEDISRCTC